MSFMSGTIKYTKTEYPKGTYQILAMYNVAPLAEITFKPGDNGGSTVELRGDWRFWDKDKLWDCIKSCASPTSKTAQVH